MGMLMKDTWMDGKMDAWMERWMMDDDGFWSRS